MRAKRWIGAVLVVGAFALAASVQARPRYLRDFATRYPNVTGTRLQSCTTCHGERPPALNPYGKSLQTSGMKLDAIEKLDSDGDHYSNRDEIRALTFPGDPKSRPGMHLPPDSSATDSLRRFRPDSTRTGPDSTHVLPDSSRSGRDPRGATPDTTGH